MNPFPYHKLHRLKEEIFIAVSPYQRSHLRRSLIFTFSHFPISTFAPSVRSRPIALLKILARTVFNQHSQTRGVAPSSLYPGLPIFFPFGEGFEPVHHRGQRRPGFRPPVPKSPSPPVFPLRFPLPSPESPHFHITTFAPSITGVPFAHSPLLPLLLTGAALWHGGTPASFRAGRSGSRWRHVATAGSWLFRSHPSGSGNRVHPGH